MHVKKNDTVKVLTGVDRGKQGRILRVMGESSRVIVEGVHFVKRHLKKGHPEAKEGGIVSKEAPIHISNVMVVCGACKEPTRVGFKKDAKGRSVRVCRACGELMEKS